MAHVLVRDLDPEVLQRLKEKAREHGRSLQSEVKSILEVAAGFSMAEARGVAEHWRRRLAGRMESDSADLVREDRER